jgi:thiol-disulfide isomerase/thioredoxin
MALHPLFQVSRAAHAVQWRAAEHLLVAALGLIGALLCGDLAGASEGPGFVSVHAAGDLVLDVEVRGPSGHTRLLWPNTLSGGPPGVRRTQQRLLDAGFELWLTDPLEARFLPRSSEHTRTLDGAGVAALIGATAEYPDKPTLLMAHGRMALPLLRGTRRWQKAGAPGRLDGLVLLYPNLFGPTPAAGDAPRLDPIVAASNWPLLILQPERGTLRWALTEVLAELWENGTAAYAKLIPEVRDWYLFHEPGQDPREDAAASRLPVRLKQTAALLGAAPRPPGVVAASPRATTQSERITGLRPRPNQPQAPPFQLEDAAGVTHSLAGYRGKVILVNFWASWCPPCVEEIPSMNRLAARYDPEAFQIVSINFQEDVQSIREFMQRVEVEFPVLLDQNGLVSRAWQVIAFPSSFLVDAQGQVRWSVNSAIAWDEPEVFERIDTLIDDRAASFTSLKGSAR